MSEPIPERRVQLSSPRPTEFDSGEYVGNVANAGSSRSSRTVTTDARTDGAPSGTTTELSSYRCIIRNRYVLSNPQYHTPRIERKSDHRPRWSRPREASSRVAPKIRQMAATCTETTWHAARRGRISRFDRKRLLWRPFPAAFFGSLTKRVLLVNIRFSGCLARFLIAQSRLVEQPPTTRNRVFDGIALVEILLDEHRRPRRRIETDPLG